MNSNINENKCMYFFPHLEKWQFGNIKSNLKLGGEGDV